MVFKWTDYFSNSATKSFPLEEIKKSKYAEYFEHLQQNLEKFAGDNALYHSANRVLSVTAFEGDLNNFLKQVFPFIPDFGFEFRRLVLINESEPDNPLIASELIKDNLRIEYLDEQMLSLLKSNERIFIGDTSKIHTLKFQLGKDIPKTVLGVALDLQSNWNGILWLANSRIVSLTKDQVDGLDLINQALSTSVNRVISEFMNAKRMKYLESAFTNYPFPALMIEGGEIILMNRCAQDILCKDGVKVQDDILEMILAALVNEKTHIELDNTSYQVTSITTKTDARNPGWILFLFNEQQSATQRNFLLHAMQAISLNFETPMNNILGYAKMVPLLAETNGSQNEYINKITREAERCLDFSADLMNLSRLNSETPFILREIPIGELIAKILEDVQHLIKQKRILVENKIELPGNKVKMDVSLFSQAVYLILEYIFDHLDPGMNIEILALQEENQNKLKFYDNGKGYSGVYPNSLSETDRSSMDSRIRAVNGIMQLHGGNIAIDSELGKGNEYILSWPYE